LNVHLIPSWFPPQLERIFPSLSLSSFCCVFTSVEKKSICPGEQQEEEIPIPCPGSFFSFFLHLNTLPLPLLIFFIYSSFFGTEIRHLFFTKHE